MSQILLDVLVILLYIGNNLCRMLRYRVILLDVVVILQDIGNNLCHMLRYREMVCPHHGQKETVAKHIKLSLVFFNTFDPIDLLPESIMADRGIPMLCEDALSQMPTLYICPVTNVLGQNPLISCYMDDQTDSWKPIWEGK